VPVEGQHDGVADPDLAVPDQSILGGHPPEFLTLKRLSDEVKEGPRVVGDDPGRNGGVTLRRDAGLPGHRGPFTDVGCQQRQ
jgi:hypothetical protein